VSIVVLALTREVSDALGDCELTHKGREPIDVDRARVQHRAYERALEDLGCTVQRLPAIGGMPDSVFIEDTAVVLPELAIVTRPGAPSRRLEVAAVRAALAPLRPLVSIEEPGTIDGGDVLRLGQAIFVGRSTRTNEAGIDQLRSLVKPHGYTVTPVETSACLHLKSAVCAIDDETVLMNPRWLPAGSFDAYRRINVDPSEPGASNVVAVSGRLLAAAAFPGTGERLRDHGFELHTVDASELAKAEGALTCCSLLVA
jgi:dimethylargininase